jgi:hypothetical protein
VDGDFWAVKGSNVHIQIRSHTNRGNTEGIAVGGPFLKGHRLTVMRIKGQKQKGGHNGADVTVKYDGTEILQTQGDKFQSSDGLVEGEHLEKVVPDPADMPKAEAGGVKNWEDFAKKSFAHPGQFVFRFPDGVEFYLARVDLLSIVIKMPKDDSQDGLCGNYDGDEKNDDYQQVEARMGSPKVESGNLFLMDYKDYSYREQGLLEVANSDATDLAEINSTAECEEKKPHLYKQAVEKCNEILQMRIGARLKGDCVFDICVTGDLNISADYLAEEVMGSEAKHDTIVNAAK